MADQETMMAGSKAEQKLGDQHEARDTFLVLGLFFRAATPTTWRSGVLRRRCSRSHVRACMRDGGEGV